MLPVLPSRRIFRVPLFLLLPLTLQAQSYEYPGLYKQVSAPPPDARTTQHLTPNGVDLEALATSQGAIWNEEVRLDKSGTLQVIHYYLNETQHNVAFAYDLLVEPLADQKIRITFSSQSPNAFADRQHTSHTVELPSSAPVTLANGSTLAIKMLPGPDPHQKIVQYLRVYLQTQRAQ